MLPLLLVGVEISCLGIPLVHTLLPSCSLVKEVSKVVLFCVGQLPPPLFFPGVSTLTMEGWCGSNPQWTTGRNLWNQQTSVSLVLILVQANYQELQPGHALFQYHLGLPQIWGIPLMSCAIHTWWLWCKVRTSKAVQAPAEHGVHIILWNLRRLGCYPYKWYSICPADCWEHGSHMSGM